MPPERGAVELDDLARDRGEEGAVVRDEQHLEGHVLDASPTHLDTEAARSCEESRAAVSRRERQIAHRAEAQCALPFR